MLILVQRSRQFEIVLFGLGIDGLRRQQGHLAILQQLENPFDLERGRPASELAFLAALLDRDAVDGILTDKRGDLSGKHFDVGSFVVIPYAQYIAQKVEPDLIPHEVVSRIVDGATPIRAWREHLNLTQDEVAKRMGITQPAFAQQETVAKPRKATREKIALAFGITASQLEL